MNHNTIVPVILLAESLSIGSKFSRREGRGADMMVLDLKIM